MVVFCLYRAAFMPMAAAEQEIFAPVWPLLKIGLKKIATFLVEKGKNPDVAPFIFFTFDNCASMCGNFLFLDAADVSNVFVIIAVEIIENFILAARVLYLIKRGNEVGDDEKLEEKKWWKCLDILHDDNYHHRALRTALAFFASEMSEMLYSAWSMTMLPILY